MSNALKLSMSRFLTTKEATDVLSQIHEGEIVFDVQTGFYYCKHSNGKFGVIVSEELSPCLGTNCDKRKYCFKYEIAKKFSEDKFNLRDFSVETEMSYDELENYLGTYIICNEDNRYRHFRWL